MPLDFLPKIPLLNDLSFIDNEAENYIAEIVATLSSSQSNLLPVITNGEVTAYTPWISNERKQKLPFSCTCIVSVYTHSL